MNVSIGICSSSATSFSIKHQGANRWRLSFSLSMVCKVNRKWIRKGGKRTACPTPGLQLNCASKHFLRSFGFDSNRQRNHHCSRLVIACFNRPSQLSDGSCGPQQQRGEISALHITSLNIWLNAASSKREYTFTWWDGLHTQMTQRVTHNGLHQAENSIMSKRSIGISLTKRSSGSAGWGLLWADNLVEEMSERAIDQRRWTSIQPLPAVLWACSY